MTRVNECTTAGPAAATLESPPPRREAVRAAPPVESDASLVGMFTRLKWFVAGSAATIGAGAYLGVKVKRARERMTAENMARAGVVSVAGMMKATGRRMQRAGVEESTGGVESARG